MAKIQNWTAVPVDHMLN